jgi:2-amino-4-hydroxy-6-hydroxymethyldihydropteridine diphosphokinase
MPEEPIVELARVFISLGSNLEPRSERLQAAIAALRTFGEVSKVSRVYETVPVGGVPQPEFLNAVVELDTTHGPLELLRALKESEKKLGRQQRPRWHEREIDFDILFYEDLMLHSPELTVPHPEIQNRAFVLVPLAELDRNFVHPVLRRSVSELVQDVDTSGVRVTNLQLA